MKWTIILTFIVTFTKCENGTTESSQKGVVIDWLVTLFDPATTSSTTEYPNVDSHEHNHEEKPPRCQYCKCGIAGKERIVGGHETKEYVYSWMALIEVNNKRICGATLINDLYVLTSAHCVYKVEKSDILIYLHVHDTNFLEDAVNLTVARVKIHPGYDRNTFNNDIALLKSNKRLNLAENNNPYKIVLRPICMPPSESSFVNEFATVIGWGATHEDGSYSNVLRQTTVPVVSREDCKDAYPDSKITSKMLCAGYQEGKHDACVGDSGSPLMVLIDDTVTHEQIGISSWGTGCGRPKKFGVYTDLTKFIDWILENTVGACYCSRLKN